MNRLTDNDKNFGPFTLGRWNNNIEATLNSGDEEDPECHLLFCAFGWALRIHIPKVIKPCKPAGDYMHHRQVFGFNLSKQGKCYNFLQIKYGAQTHDSRTTRRWSKFLPWTQWRYQRLSIYRPDGSVLAHFPEAKKGLRSAMYDEQRKFIDVCPKSVFLLKDHDGTVVTATCYIEEREWSFGEGWFKWLRYFKPNLVRRTLDIHFDQETGTEKGSWKGGTVGTSIEMSQTDTPLDAIKLYCAKEHRAKGRAYSMTFLREVTDTDQPATQKIS